MKLTIPKDGWWLVTTRNDDGFVHETKVLHEGDSIEVSDEPGCGATWIGHNEEPATT